MIAAHMKKRKERRNTSVFGALLLTGFALSPVSAFAGDPGKHACFQDAKRLCQAEMSTLSRSKVRACMIVHLEQVSPQCHTYMIAERDKAMRAKKTEFSAQ